MTGVFVRDALADAAWRHPGEYATRYYLQYPALGLMVWPPFFYVVEGGFMFLFGTSFSVALLTVGLFALLAALSFYRLICRTHNPTIAAAALLVCGLSPLVFSFSRQVMLEVPALALALTAIFHFERYLDDQWRWDALLACLFAALTALTRFDGVFLLAYFAIRLIMRNQVKLVLRWPVLLGVLGAGVLTGPYYWFTWTSYGSALSKAVKEGTGADSTSFLAGKNLAYYPLVIPEQVGWPATIGAAVGMVLAFTRCGRRERGPVAPGGPYLALLLATYLTFTPMAELEPRHAIYWVPALALLATYWIPATFSRHGKGALVPVTFVVLIGGTLWSTYRIPHYSVFGYEEAARYIVDQNADHPVCLMDGFLNGNFIYQVRRHDPERRWWVLRGDKLLYGMLSDPHADYRDWVSSEPEMVEIIYRYDPEWIIVEEPQIHFVLPGATLLRETLSHHPERFELAKVIEIRSDRPRFKGGTLMIYRNLVRNPNRADRIEYEMLNLRKQLGSSR